MIQNEDNRYNDIDFTPINILPSKLEKPKPLKNPKWLEEIKSKEIQFTYHASEDLERIQKIVEPDKLPALCRILNIEAPRFGATTNREYSFQKFPERSSREKRTEGKMKGFDESSTSSKSSKSEEFRKTVCTTILERIRETELYHAPYRMPLSREISLEHIARGREDSSENSTDQSTNVEDDLVVHPATPAPGPPADILEDLRSPFQKFFRRSKKEIENHLNRQYTKKAPTETEELFIDFINFLESPDIQLKCPNINLDSLKHLFDIGLGNPAANSFSADTMELSHIPKEISDLYNDIQASSRASLHRQIIWDILYEKGKEKKIAFGKSIPDPRPYWNKNTRNKWLIPGDIPWNLVSGQDLWKNLLNTEILEGFAKWLLVNPQYDRPKYLEKIGYFDKLPKPSIEEDPVKISLQKKRCGEAFFTLANNMKYFIGDNELSYLPRFEELQNVLQSGNAIPGEND